MAGAVTELLPSHFDKFNEKCVLLFSHCVDYSAFTVTDTYAISKHTGAFCRFHHCKVHILLYSESVSIENRLKQFESLNYGYCRVDSLYGVYKHFISQEEIVATQGTLITSVQNALNYNRLHPYMDPRPSILRKRMLRKTRKIHLRMTNSRDIVTQTVARSMDGRIQKILQSRFALDFLRIVDSLVDENGIIDSKLVSFNIK